VARWLLTCCTVISHPYSRTAITHCIREQVHMYQKSFLIGHPSEGSAFQDEDLQTSFPPSLNATASRFLDQIPSFTPVLNYLSDGELERNEKEHEKDLARRRRKRSCGRRGITLPDREVLKTYRTPAIGLLEMTHPLSTTRLSRSQPASVPLPRLPHSRSQT
jgi:SWI/SNF-related matrix-associated actin-dependent regulator of chromatin subfamily B protein 1